MPRHTLGSAFFICGISLTIAGCPFTERPPNTQLDPFDSSDPTKFILNDTGVDFFLDHDVADSPQVMERPSVTPKGAPGQDAATGADVTEKLDSDGRLGFSFTKLEEKTGKALGSDAPSWSCVKDNTTGLVWEVKKLAGEQAAGNMYAWYDPSLTNGGDPGLQAIEGDCGGMSFLKGNTYDYIQKINARGLCGFNDWRLPLREEFRSIIDYGVETKPLDGSTKKPMIDDRFFPNMLQRKHRWTAESSYNDPSKAWAFHADDGRGEVHPKACVAGGNFTNGIMLVRGPN